MTLPECKYRTSRFFDEMTPESNRQYQPESSRNGFLKLMESLIADWPLTEMFFGQMSNLLKDRPSYGRDIYTAAMTLIGCRHLYYVTEETVKDLYLYPNRVFVRSPNSWSSQIFDHQYESLVLAFFPDHIALNININDDITPGPHSPNYSFYIPHPISQVGVNLLQTLELIGKTSQDQAVSISIFNALFKLIYRELKSCSTRLPKLKTSLCQQICEYLHHSFSLPINRQTTAARFAINPEYLSRVFKKEISVGFNDYLNQLRIDQSKHMLINSTFTIDYIAEQSGFRDANYFIKVFKKYAQDTPAAFRKKCF